jgi:8-oxo-dGTP pyrophosphatase MutT (NUDIX family)
VSFPIVENPFLFDDAGPRHPRVRPKDAASLILVRRDADATRVLMGERSAGHAFLPGHFVFPGGRVEPADGRLCLATDLRPEVRAKVAAGTCLARARALGLAAIRETFEETGLLVGEPSPLAHPRTRSSAWRDFFKQGVIPRLEALDFVARAITPPGRARRFDARFFMADAGHIAGAQGAFAAGGELLRPLWLTLTEARAAKVLPITRAILSEVEARLGAAPDSPRPVPFFIPQRGKAVIVSL